MNIGQYFQDLAEGLQVISTVEIDEAQLQPGSTNTFPCNIQVATKNGHPVRLTGVTLAEGE